MTTTAGATTASRNIAGLAGDLAATQDQTGTVVLQLANLHGDIVATVADDPAATGTSSYAETTEYGIARDPATAYPDYGWLGTKQRSANALGGIVLMGVRLYNPTTGRFLSIDPIYGGNPNPYIYPANPIDQCDFDGRRKESLQSAIWHLINQVFYALSAAMGLDHATSAVREMRHARTASQVMAIIKREAAKMARQRWIFGWSGWVRMTVAYYTMLGVAALVGWYCSGRYCYFGYQGGASSGGTGQGGFAGGAGRPWLPTSR